MILVRSPYQQRETMHGVDIEPAIVWAVLDKLISATRFSDVGGIDPFDGQLTITAIEADDYQPIIELCNQHGWEYNL